MAVKPILRALFCLWLLASCQGDDQEPGPDTTVLEGTWLLTEVLFDPGDGTGEFEPSDAGFQISLFADSTFDANFHVCRVFESGDRRSGSYSRIGIDELLIPCDESIVRSIQGRLENGNLIFYYPCITPCVYRFRKVSDTAE